MYRYCSYCGMFLVVYVFLYGILLCLLKKLIVLNKI